MTLKEEILCKIDENRKRLFEIFRELISVDSQNFGETGKEKDIAEKICEICTDANIECDMYSPLSIDNFENDPDYFPGRNLENRFNADFVLKGEKDETGILLMGHSDTVPVGDVGNWEHDPFGGEMIDGKIYGRGACDDKYSIAVGLFLFELFKKEGFVPKKNVKFCAYCDEEYGGSHGALAGVLKTKADRIVNLDGSNKEIWNVGVGGGDIEIKFCVDGVANSARRTAEILPYVLKEIDKFGERRKEELKNNPAYKDTDMAQQAIMFLDIRCGTAGNDLEVGRIEFEYFTDRDEKTISLELEELVKDIDKKLEPLGAMCMPYKKTTRHFHYCHTDQDCDSVKEFKIAAKEACGIELKTCGSCLSDLSVINTRGRKDAFSFGIGRDFYENGGAHQRNEFVSGEDTVALAKIIAIYIINALG